MHAKQADFLVEIQTEELPPKALHTLAKNFFSELKTRLAKANLQFDGGHYYATPRRLAVLIQSLSSHQPDSNQERRGPALTAAFDSKGNPTQACEGFARSCHVSPDQLTTIKTNQGEFVGFQQRVLGKSVIELLPTMVSEALAALPIPRRMRWGLQSVEFVRPVHSVIMLYGDDIIDAEILGVRAGRETSGHRFHCKKAISIADPSVYVKRLAKTGFVIADFETRKQMIKAQSEDVVKKIFDEEAYVVMQDDLLEEVTGLVEWPVAVLGDFDKRFLAVPSEALISAMQDHQRYFPVKDKLGNLMPHFVTISNIEGKDMQHVIAGNERVLRARLSDAAFFFETDKKQKLMDRVTALQGVIFQAKLGTLADKARRLAKLTTFIMKALGGNEAHAARAGLLAKADLTTAIVGEFPELQGIAGYYYALHDGEPQDVALALNEHYLPRFSGDDVPASLLSCALALADRLDTLVGIFGINQQPTGDKDPFALRRAALGILRILIARHYDLDLKVLLRVTYDCYEVPLENKEVLTQVLTFILERLKPWYQEQNINPDVFASVAALDITRPYDFDRRIHAVQNFKLLPDAESLSIANKRVSNILAKYESKIEANDVDALLFEVDAERKLATQLETLRQIITPLFADGRYVDVLSKLADLRQPVDDFFDQVMVMSEDKAQRENRLLLLAKLRALFLQVADVALLQMR